MADLLECLIQIKGVADTPRRLAVRAAACLSVGRLADARDVARSLARAEEVFARQLAAMLGDASTSPTAQSQEACRTPQCADADAGLTPESAHRASEDACRAPETERPLAEWLAEFERRRAALVRRLGNCSAEDLGRSHPHPARHRMTVADLVATMLAHDTDQLGRLV